MEHIAVIPARGGSTRLPGKNSKHFHGKPIIEYSIHAAHQYGFDRVIVSTDNDCVANIAHDRNAIVLWRPAALCQNEVGTQLVARDAAQHWDCSFVCCIYATAPMIEVHDLRDGCTALVNGADFAFGVGTDPLRDAGQFYWSKREALLQGRPLIGRKTVMVPVDESRVCDINLEEDWLRAERMYAALHGLEATA